MPSLAPTLSRSDMVILRFPAAVLITGEVFTLIGGRTCNGEVLGIYTTGPKRVEYDQKRAWMQFAQLLKQTLPTAVEISLQVTFAESAAPVTMVIGSNTAAIDLTGEEK